MSASLVNQPAPDFTSTAHNGQAVRLSAFRGQQVVVLYFYPQDGTPVCAKEACSFRDAFEEFTQLGAAVIGVSGDSPERHRAFAAERRLPFLLLSDADGALCKAYGAQAALGMLPGRVTFVIDKSGVVRHATSALFSADRHVREALDVVRTLVAAPPPPSSPQP